jgi:hypothetical protein
MDHRATYTAEYLVYKGVFMLDTCRRASALAIAVLLAVPSFAIARQAPAAPQAQPAASVPLAPADAASLVGDWTIAAESPMGPSAFLLTLKVADGKVVGEISSDMQPKAAITDITKAGAVVTLRYTFDYQGNGVPAAITLTPGAAETLTVVFDFADGAFTMNGTATRKKA